MSKKSKPKQRTNWKQRALHCEEVIKIQNVLAESREKKHAALLLRAEELRKKLCDAMDYGVERDKQVELEVKLRDEYWNRALTAEKRLAEFKRSEYFVSNACVECGSKREEKYMNYVCYSAKCLRACADKLDPIRTHWQRFKSWLGVWKIAVLCVLFVLCCLAGCVAYVYWPR